MPSTADPVRIIQVGAGAMGRAWLEVVHDSHEAELVGLVDLDPGAAQRAADATGHGGVPVAGSLEQLLDRVEADALLNVTVPSAHADVSITALLHGLPVLCEKPLAETVSAGLSMIAAAELSGRLLAVSQARLHRHGQLRLLQGPPLRRLPGRDGLPAADRHGHPPVRPGAGPDRQ
jgi:predicted dehydrogenase